ncbi:hypothetical protein MTR67_041481 [Solanum verrucosum]|uniref:DUF8040 domain-containing protein n=1 Tax=Solanum verrucosum TaxID=315347 RepID=A0AAF0UMC3_SOLVR|nr:hypothetical protein MTR67_041481 [Solanum verrucosum]
MLLRPVGSDLEIHYASSTLLMTMGIRDYGLNHVRTWASGFVCVVLVVIRLVARMVAVPVLPQPAIEELPVIEEDDMLRACIRPLRGRVRRVTTRGCSQIVTLRVDRNVFHILASLAKNIGGLSDSKYMSSIEMFLNILAHHEKNRSVKVDYIRSGWSVSRAFNECLRAILKLPPVLLVKPNLVLEDDTDDRWKWFKGCLGALDGTYISEFAICAYHIYDKVQISKDVDNESQGRLLTQERKQKLHIQVDDSDCCLCEEKVMETNVRHVNA